MIPESTSVKKVLYIPGKRDMSRSRMLATLRKQKQRQRQKEAGYVKIEIEVTKEVAEQLALAGKIAGSAAKAEASVLVKRAAQAHAVELEKLARQAGALWLKAVPYLPYASYLQKPGAQFRFNDRVYRYEEWAPLYTQIGAIYTALNRWGWSRTRIDAFMRRSAKRYGAGELRKTTTA